MLDRDYMGTLFSLMNQEAVLRRGQEPSDRGQALEGLGHGGQLERHYKNSPRGL